MTVLLPEFTCTQGMFDTLLGAKLIIIIIIIINKFNGNSTELDSHIYSTYRHIKYKAIKMRRNVIRHVIRNVIHTKSIYFVSSTILTYIKCRINRNYCQ